MAWQVVAAAAALFAFGAIVLLITTPLLRDRGLAAELWRLYRVEFLLVTIALVPTWLGGPLFAAALVAFVVRGWWEWFAIHPRRGLAVWLGALWFPLLPLLSFWLLRNGEHGFLAFCLVYSVVEMNDAFATVFGKLLGRHHPFPRLSPRKTAEGLLGGILCAVATGIAVGVWLLGMAPLVAAMAAFAIALTGLAGDLATSAIKRSAGCKDFPEVHVLHGGLLDIFDSVLFAVPVFWLYTQFFPL